MRHLLIAIMLLVTVYEGSNLVVPKYYVKEDPFSKEYRVFTPGKPVIPRYIIKPDPAGGWRVFAPGKPLLPKFIIKKEGGGK